MQIDCVHVHVDIREAIPGLHHYELMPKRPRMMWDRTRVSDGIFCFYDVAKSEHFQALGDFLYKFKFMFKAQATQIWIVGVRVAEHARQVSFEAGQKLANKYDALFSEIDDGDPQFITFVYDMVRILSQPRKKWGGLMYWVT